jgi:hypothetical protein
MISSKSVIKEIEHIFSGDYDQNREWYFNYSKSEIIEKFSQLFSMIDKYDTEIKDRLISINADLILRDFPTYEVAISFSLKNIHYPKIKEAILNKLTVSYYAIYYVREIAKDKSKFQELIDFAKVQLELGTYDDNSIEIAKLLEIDFSPNQRK